MPVPDVDDTVPWDFLTLVDWWNFYGLPVLLAVVAIAVLVRGRPRRAAIGWDDGSRTVVEIGLIHCAFAVQALLFLVQELLTIRIMGIPESYISLIGALVGTLVNPVVAIGVLRRRRWARRFALTWYALMSLLAILVAAWRYYYGVPLDLNKWPEHLVSMILPFFLLAVMLTPGVKRVFATHASEALLPALPGDQTDKSPRGEVPAGWPVLSMLTLLFLIVVYSNLAVNAADWGCRLVFEPESAA